MGNCGSARFHHGRWTEPGPETQVSASLHAHCPAPQEAPPETHIPCPLFFTPPRAGVKGASERAEGMGGNPLQTSLDQLLEARPQQSRQRPREPPKRRLPHEHLGQAWPPSGAAAKAPTVLSGAWPLPLRKSSGPPGSAPQLPPATEVRILKAASCSKFFR